jgi:hypothetical protein
MLTRIELTTARNLWLFVEEPVDEITQAREEDRVIHVNVVKRHAVIASRHCWVTKHEVLALKPEHVRDVRPGGDEPEPK